MKRLAIALFAAGLASVPVTQAAAQQHLYDLTNGSTSDLVGTTNLTADGLHTIIGGVGTAFASNDGFSLFNVFTSSTDYSIVMRFRLSNPASGYQKIVDFKDRGDDDTGYYDYNGAAKFYNVATGASSAYSTINQFYTTVITRSASTNVFTAYVDGVQQFTFVDGTSAIFDGPSHVAHFFEDDAHTNGETATGVVSCIGTYNSVLAASAVANLTTCGSASTPPTTTAPEPSSFALCAAGIAALFAVSRKRKQVK